jgi:hypothetical protein
MLFYNYITGSDRRREHTNEFNRKIKFIKFIIKEIQLKN